MRATAKEYSRSPVNVAAADATPASLHTGHLPSISASAAAHAELRSALYAGIVAAVLSLIQPGASFVLAPPLGGFLSVLLYRRSLGNDPSRGTGFRLGALAGLFGFGLLVILGGAGTLAFHAQDDVHATMVQIIHQAQARNPDPHARQVFDYFVTPQGMAVFMIFSFVFGGILFVLFSGIGGAISASLLRRKAPPGQ